MLPQFVPYMGDCLLDALANTNELEIFDEQCVIDYIDFNFQMYGYKIHRFGFYIHLVTVTLLMYYVNETFMGELDIDPVTKKIKTMPEASPI